MGHTMWLEVSHSRVGVDCSVLVEERGGGVGVFMITLPPRTILCNYIHL